MKKLLLFLLLASGYSWAQTPSCNWNTDAALTTATTGPTHANNTASPQCNAFALSWWASGFSALSIQLEGNDTQGGTYTAFTGTGTVVVGPNPSTALSGNIIIQANSKIAWIRVRVNSVTGSGSIKYQVFGYSGISNSASSGGGAGGNCNALGGDVTGTCAANTVVAINGQAVTGIETTSSTKLASFTGSDPTNGNCPDFNGKSIQDSGFPCGTANAPSGTLASFTFGSPICDGCCSQAGTTIAIAAAAVGDGVTVGASPALSAGIQAVGKVTGAGVVTVEVCNWTGSAVTPTSITYKANVIHGT